MQGCVRQVEMREIEEVELDVVETRLFEAGVGETGTFEDRPGQVSAVELCPAEVGAPHVGLTEVQPLEIEAGQLSVDQIRREGRVGSAPLIPDAGAQLSEVIWIGHVTSFFPSSPWDAIARTIIRKLVRV